MKNYEITVLTKKPLFEKVRTLTGATPHYEGRKRLAYKICGEDFAHYYYAERAMSEEEVRILNDTLEFDDDILRYLIVAKRS